MRSFAFVVLAITTVSAAVTPKSVHPELRRMDENGSIEREISEVLKDIDASRKAIRMTVVMNDTMPNDEKLPMNFIRSIEDVFSGMFTAIQNTHVPFFNEDQRESQPAVIENANQTTDETAQDLLTRTRMELKEDIAAVRSYVESVQTTFDEWMISNRHQEFKSMLIGGLSAVFVLIAYFLLCKCCRRRSRMNHLSAFANDGFGSRLGDTEGLLPTKNPRRFPSNSDEDI